MTDGEEEGFVEIHVQKGGDEIHPYPTQAEAIKAAAGLYTRTRLTPRIKRLFELRFRISR